MRIKPITNLNHLKSTYFIVFWHFKKKHVNVEDAQDLCVFVHGLLVILLLIGGEKDNSCRHGMDACHSSNSRSTNWMGLLVFWYGIIYLHQLRHCHFLQGI